MKNKIKVPPLSPNTPSGQEVLRTIAARIKHVRLVVYGSRSRLALARDSGLTDMTIHRVESGTNDPGIATLVAMCGALGIEIVDLFMPDDYFDQLIRELISNKRETEEACHV